MTKKAKAPLTVGWREWVVLGGLDCPIPIKAKIDTGAATSALHAARLRRYEQDGEPWVEFTLRPHQRTSRDSRRVKARVVDERRVRSSNGRSEMRPVIETVVGIGDRHWSVQFTLSRRDEMGFRLLLGRRALRGRTLIDPGKSYATGMPVGLRTVTPE